MELKLNKRLSPDGMNPSRDHEGAEHLACAQGLRSLTVAARITVLETNLQFFLRVHHFFLSYRHSFSLKSNEF